MNIFLDMDGVLVDMNQGLVDLYGAQFHEMDQTDLWMNKMSKHKNFFRFLNPTPYAQNLFDYVKNLPAVKVEILTAIPYQDFPDIIQDKRFWVKQNINTDVVVNTTVGGLSKANYVKNPTDVLIDDTLENIQAWERAGGIGIYHNQYNPEKTFMELSILSVMAGV